MYVDDQTFKKTVKLLATTIQILTENQSVIFKLIIDASENLSADEKHNLSEQIKVSTETLKSLIQSLNGQLLS